MTTTIAGAGGITEVVDTEEVDTGEVDGAGCVDIEESTDRDNPPIDSALKQRASIRNMQ